MPLTFLFPTAPEATAFAEMKRIRSGVRYERQHQDKEYSFVCSGPGTRTAATMRQLATRDDIFVTMGYAGALEPSLEPGDVVICREFHSVDEPVVTSTLATDKLVKWLAADGIPSHCGSCYTSAEIVSDPEQKRRLAQTGAAIVEMEDYWAAQMAQQIGCRFASVRLVLDAFDFSLPDLSATLRSDGQMALAGTFFHFLCHPHHIRAALQIFHYTKKIAPRMRHCGRRICEIFA